MFARALINTISLALGAGFTLGLFLSIAHFLRTQENGAAAPAASDELETVMIAMPPPPPPPKAEEKPVVPDLSEAVALGIAEEPSPSPVKIAPSPPNLDDVLPPAHVPVQAVAGVAALESSFQPSLDVTLDENRIYQKSDVDRLPFPTSRPDPPIPASALGENRKRTATVLFVVNANGVVGNVRVLRSSNNAEFDEIIADWVQEWTFSPAIRKGKPVRCMIQQQLTIQMGHRDIFSL